METIVLYPIPVIGHLISMVELGKLILSSKPSLSIHILIPPFNANDNAPYISAVSAAVPSITFHRLPPVSLPPDLHSSSSHHETLIFEVLRLSNPSVALALSSIARTHSLLAFVIDFFSGPTLDSSAGLNVPSYFFFTSGAFALATFLYFPTLHRSASRSFIELGDALINIPGLPPFPASDMAKPILDRHDKSYGFFLESAGVYFPKSAGIIVNTFEALEHRVLGLISDGLYVPEGVTPPIHCIGPLITASKDKKDSNGEKCLSWLDSQPSRSVVFLCFGSLGLFSAEQLREIAVGLERSGQRFLWVVRNPPLDKTRSVAISVSESVSKEPELGELMPEGFLERTKERGLVVKNWAPQVAVLNHGSVGGFVTHCGWNSVLEAVWAGVPMVAWPLYAEQRLNRVALVEEIGIALPMSESRPGGFVSADEVERRVAELMASDEGEKSVRARALWMKSEAKAAMVDGGSSRVALTKLTESWTARAGEGE